MSSFLGNLKEYRNVSIDRFDKNNLLSTVYMLSHCHRDHMVGLEQPAFYRRLKSREDVYLYCSGVTKLLLLSENAYSRLADFIRVLEVGVPTTITIPDPDDDKKQYKSVMVTCLPAGHCPGAVMFLFEGNEGTALYTGDFRWEKNFATTLPALCVNGQIKPIDSMYVDTTFCVPEAFCIPSRDDCLQATAELALSWLKQSPRHFIHISSGSRYGHEPLLAHLAREAGTQVHISAERASVYDQITELKGVFTADPRARIHGCSQLIVRSEVGELVLPCGYCPPVQDHFDTADSAKLKVMVIRPSTMWFTAEPSRLNELVVPPSSRRWIHRVCYSFHSSYSELRDLVSLLRPSRVFPNVIPPEDTYEQVMARLQSFLTYKHKCHLSPAGDTTSAKPLGLLKRKRKDSQPAQSDSEGLVFDSPNKAASLQDDSTIKGAQPLSQNSTASDSISPVKSIASEHSSYQGSDHSDSDVDLFANDDGEVTPVKVMRLDEEVRSRSPVGSETRESTAGRQSGSLLLYVSGDSDDEDEKNEVGGDEKEGAAASVNPFKHFTSKGNFDTQFPSGNCVSESALSCERVNPTEAVVSSGRRLVCVERKTETTGVKMNSGVADRCGVNPATDSHLTSDVKEDPPDVIVIHSSQSSNEENVPGGASAQGQRSQSPCEQGQSNTVSQGQRSESSQGERSPVDIQYQASQDSLQKARDDHVISQRSQRTDKDRRENGTSAQRPRSQSSQGHGDLNENNTNFAINGAAKSRETAQTVHAPCDTINVDDSCSPPNSHVPHASENRLPCHLLAQERQGTCIGSKAKLIRNSKENDQLESHSVAPPTVQLINCTVGGATGCDTSDSDSDATLPPDSPGNTCEFMTENINGLVTNCPGNACEYVSGHEKFSARPSKLESQLNGKHRQSASQAVGDTSPTPWTHTTREVNPSSSSAPSTHLSGGCTGARGVNSTGLPPVKQKLKKESLSPAVKGQEKNSHVACPTVIDLTQDDNS